MDLRSHHLRINLITALIMLLGVACSYYLVAHNEQERHRELRAETRTVLQPYLNAISLTVSEALSATAALSAMLHQGRGEIENFEAIATEMLLRYPGIASLQLAPDGVIRDIVPLAGNEAVVGHNLLKDPRRTREAFLARDTGELTLAGPFPLVQGGMGAAGRLPIYLPDKHGNARFWGFAIVLLRFPDILEVAGLGRLALGGYHYRLWRIHPDSGQPQVIAASTELLLDQPVEMTTRVPNSDWTLSATPIAGWRDPTLLWVHSGIALLLVLLVTTILRLLLQQPMLLRAEIARHTRELADSESRFRSIFDHATSGIVFADYHGNSIRCNPAFCDLIGFQEEELIGINFARFTHPADLEEETELLANIIDGRSESYRMDKRYFTKAGKTLWVDITVSVIRDQDGNVQNYVGICHDITAQRQVSLALHDSEEMLQTIFDVLPIGVVITEPYGAIADCNGAAAKLLGLSREDILERPLSETLQQIRDTHGHRLSPDNWPSMRALHEKRPLQDVEIEIDVAGNPRTLSVSAMPVNNPKFGVVAVYVDVTARKQVEQALQDSKQQLAQVIEGAGLGVWELTVSSGALTVNPRWAEMFGYAIDDVEPQREAWERLIHPDDRPTMLSLLERHLEGKEVDYHSDYRMRHKDGHWVWVLDAGKVIEWNSTGEALRAVGILLDISTLRAD